MRKAVRVRWLDSHAIEGWVGGDALPSCVSCEAVGQVMRESEVEVVLSMAEMSPGGFLSPVAIPRGAIISLEELVAESLLRSGGA